MMMKKIFLITGVFGFFSLQAGAATIGSYNVDPTKGVATFSNVTTGPWTTNSHPYADITALGSNWGTVYGGGGADRRLNWTDAGQPGANPNNSLEGTFTNAIVNNAGIDVYIFESGDAPTDGNNPVNPEDPTNTEVELISVSNTGNDGSWVDMTVLDWLSAAEVGGTATSYGVYVFGLDLSSLGVASGGSVSSLFFGNSGSYNDWDPDVVWGGGAASEVPLPAAAWLFLSAIGGLAVIKRKRS